MTTECLCTTSGQDICVTTMPTEQIYAWVNIQYFAFQQQFKSNEMKKVPLGLADDSV